MGEYELWGSSRDRLYVLDVRFKVAILLNEGMGMISDRGICHGDVLPDKKHGLLTWGGQLSERSCHSLRGL